MSEAIIEVSIPMHYFGDDNASGDCSICMHPLCPDDRCALSLTKLTCCEQALCCGCFYKLLRRCRCAVDCEHVVGTCPFCRDMCRADALPIFLGKQPRCADCKATSK